MRSILLPTAMATRSRPLVWLVLVVLIGQWGCATTRGPQPVSMSVAAELRTIAVPSARFQPNAELKAPTSGKGKGAAQGAGVGAGAGAAPGLFIAEGGAKCMGAGREVGFVICGPIFALGLGVAVAGSAIGGLAGAVSGAVTAESAATIKAARSTLERALDDANIQIVLRDRVLESTRGHGSLIFVPVEWAGPATADQRVDYRTGVGDGIDTILEVSVRTLRFSSVAGGINPPVKLHVEARARLIRASDGRELYAETVRETSAGAHTFTRWAADEARLFRDALDQASLKLADDILHLVVPRGPVADTSLPSEEAARGLAASTPEPTPDETALLLPVWTEPDAPPRTDTALSSRTSTGGASDGESALIGTWTGTYRPTERRLPSPATLRIFKEDGRLVWSMVRRYEGQEFAGAGSVLVSNGGITLSGTYEPAPIGSPVPVWAGSRPIDVTYSLTRRGRNLEGVSLGADNRMEVISLTRSKP